MLESCLVFRETKVGAGRTQARWRHPSASEGLCNSDSPQPRWASPCINGKWSSKREDRNTGNQMVKNLKLWTILNLENGVYMCGILVKGLICLWIELEKPVNSICFKHIHSTSTYWVLTMYQALNTRHWVTQSPSTRKLWSKREEATTQAMQIPCDDASHSIWRKHRHVGGGA